MKRIRDFFEKGNTLPLMLGAAAFLAFATIIGINTVTEAPAGIRLEPQEYTTKEGATFGVDVMVDSEVHTNVFSGELRFNPTILKIVSIDYNTSVADLWAELPWFNNGEGTLNFGGGTTKQGGFTGNAKLLHVEFMTLRDGEGVISLHNARILLHDGSGTDARLKETVNSIVTIQNIDVPPENIVTQPDTKTDVVVTKNPPSTDLNGDGQQTFSDISKFILNIAGSNPRFDFNLDGEVDGADLKILREMR